MKQPPSLRRYMSTCFSCAAIAVLLCVTPKAVYGGPQPGSAHQLHAAFRPGSAAAPFGWATAVADFDADGTPDVAIADRADRPNGSHYRIEVHLAGGTTQSVSFLSADGALNITAIDIDHDHDTDLVVSPVLSREILVGLHVEVALIVLGERQDEADRPRFPKGRRLVRAKPH